MSLSHYLCIIIPFVIVLPSPLLLSLFSSLSLSLPCRGIERERKFNTQTFFDTGILRGIFDSIFPSGKIWTFSSASSAILVSIQCFAFNQVLFSFFSFSPLSFLIFLFFSYFFAILLRGEKKRLRIVTSFHLSFPRMAWVWKKERCRVREEEKERERERRKGREWAIIKPVNLLHPAFFLSLRFNNGLQLKTGSFFFLILSFLFLVLSFFPSPHPRLDVFKKIYLPRSEEEN